MTARSGGRSGTSRDVVLGRIRAALDGSAAPGPVPRE
jgi:hypothetical protein